MINFVYKTSFFEKCINNLKEKGGFASDMADKVEKTIKKIIQSKSLSARRLTKNGEHRLKGIIKFDLGSGYRLICTVFEETLFLLYIGTHDDCDRWIKRNRGRKIKIDSSINKAEFFEEDDDDERDLEDIYKEVMAIRGYNDEYEKNLLNQIDQSTLNRLLQNWFSS
jgi:mRNA-degrading endonuclease RelE of RelBE toxin-antitoxin system